MNRRIAHGVTGLLIAAMLSIASGAGLAQEKFTLPAAVPADAFLCVAAQHNPERQFLDEYWADVTDAFKRSGVCDDVLKLITSKLDAGYQAEFDRLRERATKLLEGVEWSTLAAREFVFAERFGPALSFGEGITIGPPDMVWLFRGDRDGAAANFAGLKAILEAIVEEVNKAADDEVLLVETRRKHGADVAFVNLTRLAEGAPPMPVALALREDVILISFGATMCDDVLALLSKEASKPALTETPRFKAAFAKLPKPEDGLVFFDLQGLLKPIESLVRKGLASRVMSGDVHRNTGMNAEAGGLNAKALAAYREGDVDEALRLVKQAHEVDPDDSIILYNLACFHALKGDRDAALEWLEKAVDAGFHAPNKIATDPDLDSLRDEPRYKSALARASEEAVRGAAEDTIVNSKQEGRAHELCMEAWEVYENDDYEKGLKLVEEAYELAPEDARVLYYLACFHALLGHKEKALDFLERSVKGGFYCPHHIGGDPDLENLRDDARYEQALALAWQKAGEAAVRKQAQWARMTENLVDWIADAVSIVDYVAEVEGTDGYSTWSESLAVLVPDATERPIYPVFGKRPPLTNFDRFLPKETMSFSVSGGFDAGELYTFLINTARIAGPKGEEVLTVWEGVQKEIGLDVQRDVLSWIDGDTVSVTLEEGIGDVTMVKVRDEDVARENMTAAVAFLAERLSELAAQNPMLGMFAPQTSPCTDERLPGFQNLRFMMVSQPFVWGVSHGHFIFGTTADAVALCLQTAAGDHPNIRANPRVMSEALIPAAAFTSVSLTDQRKLGEELAGIIGAISMSGGMAAMFIPDREIQSLLGTVTGMLGKLVPVVGKIDFYKSTATLTTFDGQAWHTRSVTHYVEPGDRGATEAR